MHVSAPAGPASHHDLQPLAQAIAQAVALPDALPLALSPTQWTQLADYLQPQTVRAGQVLIQQGLKDRLVYLIERGSLTVHHSDDGQQVQLAVVGSGSLVGEGAFFGQRPRNATVQAGSDCRLWVLTPLRFRELGHRHPEVALELTVAMAAVLARRLHHKPRRVAVT